MRATFRPVLRAVRATLRPVLRAVRATFRPVLRGVRAVLRAVRAVLRPVLRTVRATFRPVLRTVRAVLRAVRFIVAIVFLQFYFDVTICPFSSVISSITLHFLQTLPSHRASQYFFTGRSRLKCCASHAVQRVEPCSFLWSVRWSTRVDVRYGSLADTTARIGDVRFTSKSGHAQSRPQCLLSAMNGHISLPLPARIG